MKNLQKRKHISHNDSFLTNQDFSKKYKADVSAYENQLPTDWYEAKIILDATVVEKYLKSRISGSKISPTHREKIIIQKIPRINQDVFSGNNNVMVKLEIPEDIRIDDNLSPGVSLDFTDVPVKQEDPTSVTDSLDKEFVVPFCENFQCHDSDNLTFEAALKNEEVDFQTCYTEVTITQEFGDTLKNEELYVSEEFKHEESIPSYRNLESTSHKNNEEIVQRSTRSTRKRKKCLDCDDCDHGSVHDKVVTPKLRLKKSKPCSEKSKTPPKSSPRATEQKSKEDSIPKPRKSPSRDYQCAHCDYKGRRHHLIGHFRNKHPWLFPKDTVRCSNCREKFPSRDAMLRHRPVCLLFLICKFCQVNVPSKLAMMNHMKAMHPEKICREMGGKIVDKVCRNSMNGAMKTLEQTPFGQKYLEMRKYYLERESELIKLYCPKCNVTRDKIRRKNQTRCDTCESQLRYQCQKCKETRSHHRNLWNHLISKKSPCNISENFSLVDDEGSSNATNEVPTTSSDEPKRHDCEICEFKATSKTQLYEHVLKSHLDDGIMKNGYYNCPTCNMSFRVGNVRLRKHKELCGIADRFPCRFCPTTNVNARQLAYHLSALHVNELDGRDVKEFVHEVQEFRRMVKEVNIARFNDKLRNGDAAYERDYYHNGIESMLKPVCIECKTDSPQRREHCAKCSSWLNYVCLRCDELFSKYSVAWVHATRTCDKRYFTMTASGPRRNSSTTNECLFYCDHCCFKNPSKSVLSKHIERTHPQLDGNQDRFTCPKCYRIFPPDRIHDHKLGCRVGFHYTCHFCHRTSTRFRVIETHITKKHAYLVRCKDTLDEILQKVIETKKTMTQKTYNSIDNFGRVIRRRFSENVQLATFQCQNCHVTVHKNFRFVSDTRRCPKCNGDLRVSCKTCDRSYSKWESIANHFQITDCGGLKVNTHPWVQSNVLDHSYSLRQPLPEVTKSSAAED